MRFKIFLTIILFPAMLICGEDKSNVRGLGMAGATTVTSRTIDAIGINPALLAYMGIGRDSELKGKVLDIQTKQPIPGVEIIGVERKIIGVTDLKGRFHIKGIKPGKYTLLISRKGYKKVRVEEFKIEPGVIIEVTFYLQRARRRMKQQDFKIIFAETLKFKARKKPGTIIYNDRSHFSMSLVPQFGFGLGANFLNYQIYLDYFTGVDSAGQKLSRYLTDEDKQRILSSFPENVGTFMTGFDVKIFSAAFHIKRIGIGLGIRERAVFRFDIPNEFIKLPLYGNPPGSIYSFNKLRISSIWTREYSISFGTSLPINLSTIKNISVGAGIKLIHGFGYFATDKLNLSFETADSSRGYEMTLTIGGLIKTARVDFLDPEKGATFTPFPQPAGTGLGFDIGVIAEILDKLVVGFSITDIGSIRWNRNAMIISGDTSFTYSGFTTQEQMDSLANAFERYLSSPKRKREESFTSQLPTAFRFGIATDLKTLFPFFPGRMLISLDYYQPIGDDKIIFKKPKFAIGAEWRLLGFLPLRAGLSFGGFEEFAVSAGTGINLPFMELNISTGHLSELLAGNNMKHFSLALELRLKI